MTGLHALVISKNKITTNRKLRRLGSANLVGQSLRQTTVTPRSGLGVVLQDLVNVERLFRFSLGAYSCPPALTRSRNT